MKNNSVNAQMVNGKSLKQLKVALVCDWLTGIGGAERVVLELHKMFPDAPIYTSQYDKNKLDWFNDAEVRTGWLQKLPTSMKKFLPVLRAWYFSRLDLSGYDLVVSNTGAEAKAVRLDPKRLRLSQLFAMLGVGENRKGGVLTGTSTADQSTQQRSANGSNGRVVSSSDEQAGAVRKPVHICICNAPTHYYWSRYEYYLSHPGFPKGFNWLARLGLKMLVGPLRRWDRRAAQRPTHMIAISSHIQSEIKKYYGRESVIIHPPVDVARFRHLPPSSFQLPARKGYVITGRQTPYKRIDLAVSACTKLNLQLTVIGNGPEHNRLKSIAGPTVTFVTDASDADVARHLQSSVAFLFPGLEDFGISPVEAMAAGTPVIAYKAGGALDYVVEGKTGIFFTEPTVDSLIQAIEGFNPAKFAPDDIKSFASRFSSDNFQKNIQTYLQKAIK